MSLNNVSNLRALPKGYFGIGIYNGKDPLNYGTLFRSAYLLNASYLFVIGKRYRKQRSDTVKATRHLPTFEYSSFDDFRKNLPYSCMLIGIELDDRSTTLKTFVHPKQCCYLLGAEDHGLPKHMLDACHHLVKLPGEFSMNVSVAGSIVMYDRLTKDQK
jgi:tRNA G18 (ribose-2'-O)-methylase SpoU